MVWVSVSTILQYLLHSTSRCLPFITSALTTQRNSSTHSIQPVMSYEVASTERTDGFNFESRCPEIDASQSGFSERVMLRSRASIRRYQRIARFGTFVRLVTQNPIDLASWRGPCCSRKLRQLAYLFRRSCRPLCAWCSSRAHITE